MTVSIETMQRIITDNPDIAKRILPDIIRRRLVEARRELDDLGHLHRKWSILRLKRKQNSRKGEGE